MKLPSEHALPNLQTESAKRTAASAGFDATDSPSAKSARWRRAQSTHQCHYTGKVLRRRQRDSTAKSSAAFPASTDNPMYKTSGSRSPAARNWPCGLLERAGEHLPDAIYADWGQYTGSPSVTETPSLCAPEVNTSPPPCTRRAGSISDPSPMLSDVVSPDEPSFRLPAYIEPLHGVLGYGEVIYLENMGALTIPPIPLRDQLLKTFAEFVYPYMPLLNISDLVRIIDRNDGTKTVSLLLFQAVMFSGVATVDMQYLKAAGYETRRKARRDFFQRTKLIFESYYEGDCITRIQSLLLMTLWYETPDDQKDSHYWMGIAVSLSHSIGLHECDREYSHLDTSTQRLWKRISWSAYIRDRLIALGMRRPTSIKKTEFQVPMLTLEDFEIRDMAILCIEQARLCICIDSVLSAHHTSLHVNCNTTSKVLGMRATATSVAKIFDEVQSSDRRLREWEDGLAEEAACSDATWGDVESGSEGIVLHRTLLRLTYYATISTLHRPQVLSPNNTFPKLTKAAKQLESSREAVNQAASEIPRLANNLYELDLARYLPTTAITVLFPAIIIHVLNVKAADKATRRASLLGFYQCMQVIAKLQDMYAIADQLIAFLEAAICKAEATLPQAVDEVRQMRAIVTSLVCEIDASKEMTRQQQSTPLALLSNAEPQFEPEQGEQVDDDILAHYEDYYDWAATADQFTDGMTNSALGLNPIFDLDALEEPWFLGNQAMNAEL